MTTVPTTAPSAMSGASGPRTPPNASVATAASAIPAACFWRDRPAFDPLERGVAAVAWQEQSRDDDERGSGDRKPDHQVPRGRGMAERIGQVGPQPVLQVVDEGEEERSDKGGGDTDCRAEQDEAKVGASA
jgi:hypothetical protein